MSQNRSTVDRVFLFLAVFSFFYELPLIHLSFDRISPRLFDFLFVFAIFKYWSLAVKPYKVSPILRTWFYIVVVFSICSIFWALFFPKNVTAFSLMAIIRYWESYIMVKILLQLSISPRELAIPTLFGCVLIAIYCYFELQNPTSGEYEITPGNYITVPPGVIFGPLSPTYFHIGQLLSLACLIGVAEGLRSHNLFIILLSLASSWPLLYTGSRSGLGLFVISIIIYMVINAKRPLMVVVLLSLVVSFGLFGQRIISQAGDKMSDAMTIQRTMELEEDASDDSISGRLQVFSRFFSSPYDASWPVIALVGAGFNAAPINNKYRIDYGVHSMILYPFEQGGIIAFLLFLLLLYQFFHYSSRKGIYSSIVIAYTIAMILIGIGGHNFWRGFGSGNVNTYIILCMAVMSGSSIIDPKET